MITEGQAIAWVIFLLLLWLTQHNQNWKDIFLGAPIKQHLIFGCSVALIPLWLLQTGIKPGLEIHFLGLTAVTLLLGLRLAIFSSTLTLILMNILYASAWPEFGWQGLLTIIVPVSVSYLIFLISYNFLPRHLFVYIFVAAFFNGAITILVKVVLQSWVGVFRELYSWDAIVANYLQVWPLLVFPEALLNGMIITLLVVYKPSWLATYRDREYLAL